MVTCHDAASCKHEIDAYTKKPAGVPLLVGFDNAKDYREVLDSIRDDESKHVVCMSDYTESDFPPNPNLRIDSVKNDNDKKASVWIGAVQAAMLRGKDATEEFILNMLGTSVPKPIIVLCPYCNSTLLTISQQHEKLGHWIVLFRSEIQAIPSIELSSDAQMCVSANPAIGIKGLLKELETNNKAGSISVISSCSAKWLELSLFPLVSGGSHYNTICKKESTIAAYTQEENGSPKQWKHLAEMLMNGNTFSSICQNMLGDIDQLPNMIADVVEEDNDTSFLVFIALKAFYSEGNSYLNECVRICGNYNDLQKIVYNTILTVMPTDNRLLRWTKERRRILQSLEPNHALLVDYCNRATIFEKDILKYLCEDTEEERAAIIHAICCQEYSEAELSQQLKVTAPNLALYLSPYAFDSYNTKVLDSDTYLHDLLTSYFQQYKQQKISNRIEHAFIELVETEAVRRSYTKLQARSSIVKRIDKTNMQPYFIDALGVEYLAFIAEKCDEYGMIMDCHIGRCNLPSITSKNKEFYDAFPTGSILKEDGLDDLKHQGIKYDYRTTTEPIHIFDELAIIDKNLKTISSCLATGKYKKAAILSDHGATRLAVIYKSENSKLELEEDGSHSGRCCPVSVDPGIPFASFEDGFAVLANYERFKGGRRADVETHGGASLEEVVVPVIVLSQKPKEQQLLFKEDQIKCSIKDGAVLELFANPPISDPRIVVDGTPYKGAFCGDQHNVRFEMPTLRRKGHYEAEVYDGGRRIGILTFDAARATKTNDLF